MKTLLLLTCGTNACYHVAKTLKENYEGKFRIVGTDINQLWMIPTAPYLDAFYKCPYSSSSDYYPFILDICKKEEVNYILPSFDVDQQMFFCGNLDLKELGVTSLGIDESIRDMYISKEETNKYLSTIGLPTPTFYNIANINDETNYFIKPKHGVGSIGAKVVKGCELLKHREDEILIQEICSEPEVTLECFNYKGFLRSVARVRLGCKSGVCTKTRIYNDPKLHSIAKKFASCTKLPYIFNLQFMKNSQGSFVITDVNLRTAGGMSLSFAAGWDEVSALANIMLDMPDECVLRKVDTPIAEQYVIRAYTDIVTKKIQRRIAFDLDGTLLDSRLRHSVLMKDILTAKGLNLDTSNLVSFKASGVNNIAWLESQGIEGDLANEINKEWIAKIEYPEYLKYDLLYEDTKQVLSSLSKNNSLYLITARSNEQAVRNQVDLLKISQYFENIYVVPSGKQSPELKSKFLRDNGIDYMVGDTEVDQKAAMNANCEFRVCFNGFRSKEFWLDKNVKKFSIEELLK